MVRPVVHSQKHYVQITRSTVTTVTRNNERLITAVGTAAKDQVDEVIEGAIVKAVYVELWVIDAGNAGSHIVTLGKTVEHDTGPTFTEMNALGVYTLKKNVLFTHQGLTNNDGIDPPMVVMRGWYKIPKSKQRFGLGDTLNLNIANNSAQDLFYCGFATYKEYS